MKQLLLSLLFSSILLGCSTTPKTQPAAEPVARPQRPAIDYHAIQHDLGMDTDAGWVGYREKRFDACRYASELPDLSDCGRAFFVVISFQLSCRPSDETDNPELIQSELPPVRGTALTWRLGGASGNIRTDYSGYGQVLTIAGRSLKGQRLRVSTGEDFLLIAAGSATRIVTPASWCR
jgi:hypothetical protein